MSDILVLTAAHCVDEEAREELFVYAGNNSITGGKVRRGVLDKMVHDQYKQEGLKNDLALLQVSY